jgi:hypothetical protein
MKTKTEALRFNSRQRDPETEKLKTETDKNWNAILRLIENRELSRKLRFNSRQRETETETDKNAC